MFFLDILIQVSMFLLRYFSRYCTLTKNRFFYHRNARPTVKHKCFLKNFFTVKFRLTMHWFFKSLLSFCQIWTSLVDNFAVANLCPYPLSLYVCQCSYVNEKKVRMSIKRNYFT